MTTKYTKEQILQMLEVNDKAVNRAVLAIYNRQTTDEQTVHDTRYRNSIGFNASDAKVLSYYASYINKNGSLTGPHLIKARNKIKKYWRQLLEIANTRTASEQSI